MAKPASCNMKGCGDDCETMGYCRKHYRRLIGNGTQTAMLIGYHYQVRTCIFDDCDYEVWLLGYCKEHYDEALAKQREGGDGSVL